MQEDFLHYIWKHKAFDSYLLKTTKGETVSIINLGRYDYNANHSFFEAAKQRLLPKRKLVFFGD